MNNLAKRAIFGSIYVALIVAAALLGSSWFVLLTTVFAILGVSELQKIVKVKHRSPMGQLIGIVDMVAVVALCGLPILGTDATTYTIATLLTYLLLRGVLALYDKRENPFRLVAWSLTSLIYIGLPIMALNSIYCSGIINSQYLVLAIFALIWLNDTGAYCVGTLMGRHKMFPRLSPKKSWEGWFGGFLFCILAGWAAAQWLEITNWQVWQWIVFGAIVCVFSTWGDLFESMIKRNAGVKDSGNIIPGHGGILDRIDSLLFVAPIAYIFLIMI